MKKNSKNESHYDRSTDDCVASLVGAIIGTLVGIVLIIIGVLSLKRPKQPTETSNSSRDKCSSGSGIIFIIVGIIVSISCWLWWSVAKKIRR